MQLMGAGPMFSVAAVDYAEAALGGGLEWELAKYALVSWIDEILVETPWSGRDWWSNNVLEVQPNICVLIDFENMAVSAEQVDQEFDLTPVMELLKTRGRLAIKRAYVPEGMYDEFCAGPVQRSLDGGTA